MLAYQQGGSGTLGGSSYSPVNVGAAAAQGALGGSASAQSVAKTKTEDKLRDALVRKTFDEAKAAHWAGERAYEETENARVMRRQLQQEFQIRKAELSSAKHVESFYNSPMGKTAKYFELGKRSLPTVPKTPKRQLKK